MDTVDLHRAVLAAVRAPAPAWGTDTAEWITGWSAPTPTQQPHGLLASVAAAATCSDVEAVLPADMNVVGVFLRASAHQPPAPGLCTPGAGIGVLSRQSCPPKLARALRRVHTAQNEQRARGVPEGGICRYIIHITERVGAGAPSDASAPPPQHHDVRVWRVAFAAGEDDPLNAQCTLLQVSRVCVDADAYIAPRGAPQARPPRKAGGDPASAEERVRNHHMFPPHVHRVEAALTVGSRLGDATAAALADPSGWTILPSTADDGGSGSSNIHHVAVRASPEGKAALAADRAAAAAAGANSGFIASVSAVVSRARAWLRPSGEGRGAGRAAAPLVLGGPSFLQVLRDGEGGGAAGKDWAAGVHVSAITCTPMAAPRDGSGHERSICARLALQVPAALWRPEQQQQQQRCGRSHSYRALHFWPGHRRAGGQCVGKAVGEGGGVARGGCSTLPLYNYSSGSGSSDAVKVLVSGDGCTVAMEEIPVGGGGWGPVDVSGGTPLYDPVDLPVVPHPLTVCLAGDVAAAGAPCGNGETGDAEADPFNEAQRAQVHAMFRIPLVPVFHAALRVPGFAGAAAGSEAGEEADTPAAPLLRNVHEGVDFPKNCTPATAGIVGGAYDYFHYKCDGHADAGWGCAYRSLQTLISWFLLNGYTPKACDVARVPTITELQALLLEVDASKKKIANFVGSSEWIGSTEIYLVLDTLFEVPCTMLHVAAGAELSTSAKIHEALRTHFATHRTPVMIGGHQYAHTILGVALGDGAEGVRFLILDPHYAARRSNRRAVHDEGWCAWKKPSKVFKGDAWYNICCPQRPRVA